MERVVSRDLACHFAIILAGKFMLFAEKLLELGGGELKRGKGDGDGGGEVGKNVRNEVETKRGIREPLCRGQYRMS